MGSPTSWGPATTVSRTDVGLAVLVTVMTMVGTADAVGAGGPGVEGYLLIAAAGLPLVWRRRWPMGVFFVGMAAMLVYFLRGHPEGLVWLPATVAVAAVTVRYGWRRASVLVVICALGASYEDLSGARFGSLLDIETLAIALGLGCSVAIGEWLRARAAYLDVAEERAALAEATQRQEADRQVGEERLRIAREVHDVVAHALASISVQAGVGQHLGRRDPARSQEIFDTIRVASHTALEDLRSTLGVLRADAEGKPPASPGLDDVDRLVAMAREAGLQASCSVVGDPEPRTERVDVAAYRIVQESVTNAIKHAGDARLSIELRHLPDAMRICVEDDGAGTGLDGRSPDQPNDSCGEGGQGIRGMRERAAMLGGWLLAGPTDGGGFRIVAHLPTTANR